jgi:hypothetical protein
MGTYGGYGVRAEAGSKSAGKNSAARKWHAIVVLVSLLLAVTAVGTGVFPVDVEETDAYTGGRAKVLSP